MHTRSALLLGVHHDRRLAVAEELRGAGFVVVEAATTHRAEAVLRHFRFDVLAIDFCGLNDGLLEMLPNLHTESPEIGLLLSGPLIDHHLLGRFSEPPV